VRPSLPPKARLPFSLPPDTPPERIAQIQSRIEELSSAAQYGWGHTLDFGPFEKKGILGDNYLRIAAQLDDWGWWPLDLSGARVADVGAFTGGLSLYLAGRGAERVYAVDELSPHLDQCAYLAQLFGQDSIQTVDSSIYRLTEHIEEASLDLVLLAGVIYHLSDMLVGLYVLNRLLKPGGTLIIESNAVEDFKHSYANFGRFYKGMWWQPSGLCLKDMCEFMGFAAPVVRFYIPGRCLARAVRATGDIPFKRGLHWTFDSLADSEERTTDEAVMAPVTSGRLAGRLRTLTHRLARRG
jgi:SAM-dependent methyltransferase